MSEQNKPENQDKGQKGKQPTPPGGEKTPQGGQPTPPSGAKQPETKAAPGKGAKAPEKGREAPPGKPEGKDKAPKGREPEGNGAKPSPSSDKSAKQAEPRKPNGNGRYSGVNRGLAVAALLLALAAAGGAGYLWQELQKTRGSIEAMQGATGDRINQLQSARDQLAGRVEAQQGTITQLQQNLQSAQRERQALTQAMRHLRTRLSQDRTEWTLAEVEYLLTVANQSLRLRGSVPTAMAALQAADQQLAQMSDPALIPVRQAIATELQQLRAVPQVDTSGVAARIGGLIANVDELPITGDGHTFSARAEGEAGQAPQPEGWTDWRGWLSSIGHQLKGLVTIKEAGEVGRPVMSPEQQYFLRQNLRLKLETARTALLEGQPAVYGDSLNEAAQWVSEYFQTESDTTRAFENTLQELAKVDLQPQLPDISASLRTLRKTMDQLQQRSGGNQPATQGGGEAAQ
jgi:uroporphyrin-3 C-methyltransferase